ncbi:glycosyltransferase [Novosphingobium sp. Fuku2-ISO-50]|uniref:glycosyltransferase n=1 Tax=Novosphingobium sp. Fuku2-ISO-50 TaxID=1739114 RepID=UPI00076C2381|nr:glycosyltransferase [Novosphingobium sp. Fuku2-ISO-50]KUR80299.1 glycosyl transferase family 2 [Novosphingobium sp. Fuku2-ISO-50]
MQHSVPSISVAMSVYNGERFLAGAIESVLEQTFADFEFLILDDGSRDATRAIVAHYAGHDPRIRLIARENRGLVASLNELLAVSRAPLIARMDADDLCLPERFAHQIAFLDDHPEIGVLGSWTDDIDETDAPYRVDAPDHPIDHEGFLAAIDAGHPLLCHPAVMFRRELVLSVGGYHPAFRHCEDLDLWLRLASVTRVANLPERLLRYRHYSQQVSSRHATEQQINAAVSRIAYAERLAGRADPTSTLSVMPPIDNLDALFGQTGVAQEVRARVAPGLLYSRAGLGDAGFDIVCRYIREGGCCAGLWRTVARLVLFGYPLRALRLAMVLATHNTSGRPAARTLATV